MHITDISKQTTDPSVPTAHWGPYQFELHTSVQTTQKPWDAFVNERNILLSSAYLMALESHPPGGMSFYYLVVREGSAIVGVIYMQLKLFDAKESLNYTRLANDDPQHQKGSVLRSIKEFAAGRVKFYTLLCGNSLMTGCHGYILDNRIDRKTELRMIDFALSWTREHAASVGKPVRLTFIKDFLDPRFRELHQSIDCLQYHEFTAQPNMVMHLRPEWQKFDDYLDSLQSKYRVRVRRARKKSADITVRPLGADEIAAQSDVIYRLYQKVARRASFNLFILDDGYMAAVKRNLANNFKLLGYYQGDQLVAFSSMMANGDELEAHFLGYEFETNRKKQLYLNILLDMIEIALRVGFDRIVFSRTAMEIKSSVGAEPYPMHFYLQHSNALFNKILPRVYNLLDPKVEWTPRNPFGDQSTD